jgi:hypothetical protein
MLGYMARSFMAAIEPTLKEDNMWNEETEEAWNSLLRLITNGIQRGYVEQSNQADQSEPTETELVDEEGSSAVFS